MMKSAYDLLADFARFIGFRETAGKLVREYMKSIPASEHITFDVICDVVLTAVWIGNPEDFYSHTGFRHGEYVRCRSFIYLFARLLTPLSFNKIGKAFDKHHATVMTAIKTLLNQMYLPENKKALDDIINEFTLRGYMVSGEAKYIAGFMNSHHSASAIPSSMSKSAIR